MLLWKAGDFITISEIAEKAQVSRATVSRVINRMPGVKEETRKRIEAIIQEENYVPNNFARSLVIRKSYVIGVLVYHVKQPFWAGIVDGIFDLVYDTEYCLFVLNSKREEDSVDYAKQYKKNLYKLIQQRVDGIIIALANPLDQEDIRLLQGANMPYVIIQETKGYECCKVNVDNVKGMGDMTRYLLELGHRKIVHLTGGAGNGIAEERIRGFVEAMEGNGITLKRDGIIYGGTRFQDGYWGMKRILEQPSLPTAIAAYNDVMAYGAYTAAMEKGIRIPDQISIAGFDRIAEEMDYSRLMPDLTTMEQPMKKLGMEAAKSLLAYMKDGKITEKTYEVQLYKGGTCRGV